MSKAVEAGDASEKRDWPSQGVIAPRNGVRLWRIAAFKWRLLVLLVVAGPLAALLCSEFFLVRYRGAMSLPLQGDVQLFRRAEEILRSADWFQRSSQADRATPAYVEIERQLRRGASKPLVVEHSFRFVRGDLREVPEAVVAKEIMPQLQLSRSALSELVVYGIDARPDLAGQVATVGMRFARDALLRISLLDAARTWNVDGASELATVKVAVVNLRSSIESLSRRISEMERIRDKYQEGAAPASGERGVQVQVRGARYLSPAQQIVGLESERIDKIDELRLAEASGQRLETLRTIGATLEKLLRAEPNTTKVLLDVNSELQRVRDNYAGKGVPLPVSAAFAEIERQLVALRARFIDAQSLPLEATVRREGPGRGVAAATGLLAALALWLVFVGRDW